MGLAWRATDSDGSRGEERGGSRGEERSGSRGEERDGSRGEERSGCRWTRPGIYSGGECSNGQSSTWSYS